MCLLYKLCTTSGLWLTSGRLAIEHKHTTQLMYVCMYARIWENGWGISASAHRFRWWALYFLQLCACTRWCRGSSVTLLERRVCFNGCGWNQRGNPLLKPWKLPEKLCKVDHPQKDETRRLRYVQRTLRHPKQKPGNGRKKTNKNRTDSNVADCAYSWQP